MDGSVGSMMRTRCEYSAEAEEEEEEAEEWLVAVG